MSSAQINSEVTVYTYVMSDIHGCFDKLREMLKKIEFKDEDQLIIAGDYIDRGPQNYEMLNWILDPPGNVLLLCGNHDREFVTNVKLMQQVMETEIKGFDINSADANKVLYQLTALLLKEGNENWPLAFDHYGTIGRLIDMHGACFKDLARWAVAIEDMPYYFKLKIGDRKCIVVHAGYIESLKNVKTRENFASPEDFYIYAREDAYLKGGIEHGMVIAGHTPTLAEKEFTFNNGDVFRYYDKKKDCIYYDIDCGCSYAEIRLNAKLACIRLEDEKLVYL